MMMRTFFVGSVLLACAVGAGCSSGDVITTPVDHDAGTTTPVDAVDMAIAIPATTASFTAAQDTTFHGAGSGKLGAISLSHGVGTIQFADADADAFFFNATAVPTGTGDAGQFATYRDFEIIAAQPNRLVVVFLTCTGNDLTYVYYETTDGIASAGEVPATGTCAVLERSTTEAVSLPAVDLAAPQLVSGFTMRGTELAFDGTQPGTASLAGDTYALYPFHSVDCTACASPGWYELHSLFWNRDKKKACLGIFYLEKATTAALRLAYAVCLPQLDDPLTSDQRSYESRWTSP